ncbi:MAG: glycosyltransferase family 4 protein [Anaerolineae bacterium]|jgi:glycosyltransferase involved in cell wall biosynthesis|nr:glycosyltransferase family 4 protein [Anaerolineae bacterium]MBT7069512.1 glycosyltransferase family 4 protein [Anaerolineae bacterium]MBT7325543.1 glycosyltransferase family 4 protein [Anaerolineae bacterium]
MKRICIYPRVESMGGVGSFRIKFAEGLKSRGIEVSYDLDDPHVDLILLLAGTRNLAGLQRARQRGVPIIQRLDGINWVQRVRWTGFRYHIRAEYGNAALAFIRRRFADGVVYQSKFTQRWWEDWYKETRVLKTVIHNAVDLDMYSPKLVIASEAKQSPSVKAETAASGYRPPRSDKVDKHRILLVEGSLAGGLDVGLRWGVELAETLADILPTELLVVGRVDEHRKAEILANAKVDIQFLGVVPRKSIPDIDRSAQLYFSAEANPPCPNAVIEALACGLPVLGFDTGSLAELVPPSAGRTVAYGANEWKLAQPDIPALAEAALEILANRAEFSAGARKHAEENLGLDLMVDKYLSFMEKFL